MDFAEGLRVIGVKPDEKIALFADNSCRWLVADQGALKFHFLHFQCIESRGYQLHKSRVQTFTIKEKITIIKNDCTISKTSKDPSHHLSKTTRL